MRRRDLTLAIVVVLIWGLNFVAIDEGLRELPPLLFVALRFALTALPAVFFVPKPAVGWRTVLALGLLMCVGQFGFLFVGMSEGMPAGLASVIMQTQALFTVLLAAAVLRERPGRMQLAGLAVAAAGVAVIGINRGGAVPAKALGLLLIGSACWAGANVVTRSARPTKPFSLLVYSALVAPAPLVGLSLLIEGPARDASALRHVGLTAVWSMAFVVVLATFFGFGAWYWLLGKYESSVVAPFALLVPVTGLSSAWVFLAERPTPWQAVGSALAILGVAVIVWGARRASSASRAKPAEAGAGPAVAVPYPVVPAGRALSD